LADLFAKKHPHVCAIGEIRGLKGFFTPVWDQQRKRLTQVLAVW